MTANGTLPSLGTATGTAPYVVALYLVPEFPMMAFASAIEPLRSANRLSGHRLFEWMLYSRDGKPVRASNGIEIAVHGSLADRPSAALVLVCAGTTQMDGPRLTRWLRDAARQGSSIGGISLGAYALAEAGLVEGRRVAVHWESFAAFAEKYPRVRATTDLYVVDDNRCTCSGGTGAMDMMLHVIASRHGRQLAHDVSEQFIHPRIRSAHDNQRMALQTRLGVANQKLIDAVAMMEEALDEPRDVREIAAAVGLSPRQLERLFARYLDANPSRYYLELRLAQARHMLSQTTHPILDIAIACGFASASHFSRCYRMLYAKKPSEERLPATRRGRTRAQP